MKRSEINRIMKDAIRFIKEQKFHLPKFAFWTMDDWKSKGDEVKEIVENHLGWDITDFGSENFYKIGLLTFTFRNGNLKDVLQNTKPYCEKLLIVEEEQVTPMHHHYSKKEDIINRGGGILQFEVYKSSDNDEIIEEPITISIDGVSKLVQPREIIELEPGDSIYILPDIYHKFWGKKGFGTILVGEVSTVNDDYVDNKFYEGVPRFSNIEEDEEPFYLLFDDYKKYLHF